MCEISLIASLLQLNLDEATGPSAGDQLLVALGTGALARALEYSPLLAWFSRVTFAATGSVEVCDPS